MNAIANRAIKMYDAVGYDASVEFADQHALVAMLFRSLLGALSDSERFLQEKQYVAKGAAVSKAQNILHGLRSTLDFTQGGEVAENLAAVYDYCMRSLIRFHAKNDVERLQEARKLLSSLENAWQLIPVQLARQQH